MRFGELVTGSDRRRVTARSVLSICHRFQVCRVDASRSAAQVINVHPVRDGADCQLVGDPMGHAVASAGTKPYYAVAFAGLGGDPQPAGVGPLYL